MDKTDTVDLEVNELLERPLDKLIIEKISQAKNPLVMWILRQTVGRIMAIKPVEDLIKPFEDLEGVEFIEKIVDELDIKVDILGLENIPKEGGVIIAPNHHTGFMDFMVQLKALKGIREDIKVMAVEEAQHFGNFSENVIPVFFGKDARKKNLKAIREMNQHAKNGGLVIVFPSGEVAMRNEKGIVEDSEWKNGATRSSEIANVPIIVSHVDADTDKCFRRLQSIAKHLPKIIGNKYGKIMGEFLPFSALFRVILSQKGKTIKVTYSKPFKPGTAAKVLEVASYHLRERRLFEDN